jgi:hypothetical protein
VLHKFLTPKPRNNSHALCGANVSDAASAVGQTTANGARTPLNISDIRRSIERYNEAQQVLNEELFGPVQNDSLIIVVQVRHILLFLCPHQLCSETHPAVPVSSPIVLFVHAATYCVIIQTQRTQISGRNSNGTKHSGGPPEDGREKRPKHVGVLYLQTRF